MTAEGDREATVAAWNQVGVALETMQTTWTRLADRNFGLWKDIAASMQDGPITASKLAGNAARAMTTAIETATDLWASAVELPQRQIYAQQLPTAFLFFQAVPDENGKHHYAGQDPIHLPVSRERKDPPAEAMFTLSGTTAEQDTPLDDALNALRAHLVIRLKPGVREYLLETVRLDQDPALVPGDYEGVIYLPGSTILPLANLRVVVEKAPDGS